MTLEGNFWFLGDPSEGVIVLPGRSRAGCYPQEQSYPSKSSPYLHPESLTQTLEGVERDVNGPLLDLLVMPGIDPDGLGGLLLGPMPLGTQLLR